MSQCNQRKYTLSAMLSCKSCSSKEKTETCKFCLCSPSGLVSSSSFSTELISEVEIPGTRWLGSKLCHRVNVFECRCRTKYNMSITRMSILSASKQISSKVRLELQANFTFMGYGTCSIFLNFLLSHNTFLMWFYTLKTMTRTHRIIFHMFIEVFSCVAAKIANQPLQKTSRSCRPLAWVPLCVDRTPYHPRYSLPSVFLPVYDLEYCDLVCIRSGWWWSRASHRYFIFSFIFNCLHSIVILHTCTSLRWFHF